jgi:NitT/TauT family transport system ATP-binding protein
MSQEIKVEGLGVTYVDKKRQFKALEDVSFTVQPGEFVSVIGSSGCGKSTLLSVLEGLREPTEGTAQIGGRKITGPALDRAVVFQAYSLFPWLSAQKNVELAVKQSHPGLSRREVRALAAQSLERVGLATLGGRFPKELSGGQQQRVAIARALAQDSEVLLMDEPFGAIDAKNRALLQDLLLELWEADGAQARDRKTVLFVTHDLDEAILLSDRIIMMEADVERGVPGHVRAQFEVPLPRPRHRLELLKSADYTRFRMQLSEIFFDDETPHNPRAGYAVTHSENSEFAGANAGANEAQEGSAA